MPARIFETTHVLPADKHRIIAVSVLTLVALPVLWSNKSDSANIAPGIAAIGAGEIDPGNPTRRPVPKVTAPTMPAYFATGDTRPDEFGAIATAPRPTGSHLSGDAVYRRLDGMGNNPCLFPYVPFDTVVTVTNLDNGQAITCRNVAIEAFAGDAIIVLDTRRFQKIASLVESPIPVDVSW